MLDPRTVLASLCLFAFGITIGFNSGAAADNLTGTANPDPSHITGAPGDDTIKLQPRNDIDDFRKECLLEGLDDIGLTLQHLDKIVAYEKRRGMASVGN